MISPRPTPTKSVKNSRSTLSRSARDATVAKAACARPSSLLSPAKPARRSNSWRSGLLSNKADSSEYSCARARSTSSGSGIGLYEGRG